MELRDILLRYLVREGPSLKNGNRVWDISHRKFLYMSKDLANGFLNLRNHPRYKEIIIDNEIELLNKNGDKILSGLENESFNLVDMGCGEGTKAKAFLNLIKDSNSNIKFCPVSVNKDLIDNTLEIIKNENFSEIKAYASFNKCFESLDEIISELRCAEYQRNVVLLLGSILASFDIHDYLFNVSNAMFPGDTIIIGNGIKEKENDVNLETYKNPLFNEWTINLMKEIGFLEEDVEFDVRFVNDRIEMFYQLNVDKEINFEGNEICFKKGDEVLVATLHKYSKDEFEKFCKMYFSDVDVITDDSKEYAIVVCKK